MSTEFRTGTRMLASVGGVNVVNFPLLGEWWRIDFHEPGSRADVHQQGARRVTLRVTANSPDDALLSRMGARPVEAEFIVEGGPSHRFMCVLSHRESSDSDVVSFAFDVVEDFTVYGEQP